MKITVATEALARVAKLASDVADKKSPMDALKMATVKVAADGLSVSATNLATSATARVPYAGKKPIDGALAVDAAALCATAKALDGETTTLYADDKLQLTIECGGSKIVLPGAAADAMPAIPEIDASKLHEVPAADFARIVRRGSYPVDGSVVSRIRGVIVEATGKELVVCGVSGHRLAEQRMPATVPSFATVVNGTGLQRIVSALDDADGTARIGVQAGYFAACFDTTTVMVKLEDDKRMPYEQVLQRYQATNVVTVNREALLRATRLASLVSDQMSEKSLDSFQVGIDGGELVVKNSHHAKGDASTRIEAKGGGTGIFVGVTWRYLVEALSHVDTEAVSVGFGDEASPIVVRPVGREGELHLIMVRSK